jgi:hypothetical protein
MTAAARRDVVPGSAVRAALAAPPWGAKLLVVTELEAGDDRDWFLLRPQRRYRVRRTDGGWWLVRRRGDVLLRTFSATTLSIADTDKAIAVAWYSAAYPDQFFARAARRDRNAVTESRRSAR